MRWRKMWWRHSLRGALDYVGAQDATCGCPRCDDTRHHDFLTRHMTCHISFVTYQLSHAGDVAAVWLRCDMSECSMYAMTQDIMTESWRWLCHIAACLQYDDILTCENTFSQDAMAQDTITQSWLRICHIATSVQYASSPSCDCPTHHDILTIWHSTFWHVRMYWVNWSERTIWECTTWECSMWECSKSNGYMGAASRRRKMQPSARCICATQLASILHHLHTALVYHLSARCIALRRWRSMRASVRPGAQVEILKSQLAPKHTM